jgi:phage shock protein A
MSDQPTELILVMLRRLDQKVDRLVDDVQDLKHRMTMVEQQVANLAATEAGHYASVSARLDRVEQRLDRLERRLDIVPAQ